MNNINVTHHRHSIRLSGYDYSGNGAYFVTLCSIKRDCLFGSIANGRILSNSFGDIVSEEWLKTPGIRPNSELGIYSVMPNHFHAIVLIDNIAGDRPVAPTGRARGPQAGSVGSLIAGFKSSVTRRINEMRRSPREPVWQRNYYEHVIRNEAELNQIHDYIEANPALWDKDENNPETEIGHA
jgi:REP element-mobilizing transposase RayT